jgi:hypothetical protein
MKRIQEIAPEVELVKTRLGSVELNMARGGKEIEALPVKRWRSWWEGLHQTKGSGTSMDELLRMLDVNEIEHHRGTGSQQTRSPRSAAGGNCWD